MVKKDDDESLSRNDLDTILEVNKKSIEIQIEVSDQNEKIIEALEDNQNTVDFIKSKVEDGDRKLEENQNALEIIKSKVEENERKLLKIEIFLATGIISLLIQLALAVFKK